MINEKTIALVAHDNRKKDLTDWAEKNFDKLIFHKIICTGTTGKLVEETINKQLLEHKLEKNVQISKLKSGPLGGDQQLGALICEGKVDIVIFLWDPMQPQPHDVDVKALMRIAVLYNVPIANNRATADFMITSSLFNSDYKPELKDYSNYINRNVNDLK